MFEHLKPNEKVEPKSKLKCRDLLSCFKFEPCGSCFFSIFYKKKMGSCTFIKHVFHIKLNQQKLLCKFSYSRFFKGFKFCLKVIFRDYS